jgi:hypothetical protein
MTGKVSGQGGLADKCWEFLSIKSTW